MQLFLSSVPPTPLAINFLFPAELSRTGRATVLEIENANEAVGGHVRVTGKSEMRKCKRALLEVVTGNERRKEELAQRELQAIKEQYLGEHSIIGIYRLSCLG